MQYNRSDYGKSKVQLSSFVAAGGTCEYHHMVHASAEGSFREQLDVLHAAFDEAVLKEGVNASPVFVRYFLSDVANQADILKASVSGKWNCAVSVIGQPPLDGSKAAMWVYMVSDAEPVSGIEGIWSAEYLGYRHLY